MAGDDGTGGGAQFERGRAPSLARTVTIVPASSAGTE
jgi:hypothetical protein